MGMFAKRISEAKPGENQGLLFDPGLYPLVQVMKVKLFESKKPGREGTDMMAIEFDVIESKCASRPPGMTSVAQILNGSHVGAARDGINFLVAVFPNVDPKEWEWDEKKPPEEQAVNIVASPLQPARGRLVSLEVYPKKNEKKGTTFTVHKYTPVGPDVQARAAELRAMAGLKPL